MEFQELFITLHYIIIADMKPKILLLMVSVVLAFSSSSQYIEVDGDVMHWEVGFNTGLNNDVY